MAAATPYPEYMRGDLVEFRHPRGHLAPGTVTGRAGERYVVRDEATAEEQIVPPRAIAGALAVREVEGVPPGVW